MYHRTTLWPQATKVWIRSGPRTKQLPSSASKILQTWSPWGLT